MILLYNDYMLSRYWNAFINIFFPRLCFYCRKPLRHGILCRECLAQINRASCTATEKNGPLDELFCAVEYHEPIVTLIHKFKYGHCRWLAKPLSRLAIKTIAKNKLTADVITAVPSHPAKIKERGYNPPALIAQKLANYLDIPFIDDIIYARAYRPSQTALTRKQRACNIEGIFSASEHCRGKKIIIVDDVYTSGATINSCAKVLKEKGAAHITAITIAKAYENIT